MARKNSRGRGNSEPWRSGSDAAYMEPRMIPDDELLPRDNSGGPGFDPYTAEWDDGGRVTGPKSYLSAGRG